MNAKIVCACSIAMAWSFTAAGCGSERRDTSVDVRPELTGEPQAVPGQAADVDGAGPSEKTGDDGATGSAGTLGDSDGGASTALVFHAVDPTNTYFADIRAMGTGCPPGSARASITPDGKAFTVLFDRYEATLDQGEFVAVKDCLLSLRIHSRHGHAFAVRSLDYAGQLTMSQAGMTAKQSASYYFQGDRLDAADDGRSWTGPFNGPWAAAHVDESTLPPPVWSTCGVERDLNVATRIVVRNNVAKTGRGRMNVQAAEGFGGLRLHVIWRPC